MRCEGFLYWGCKVFARYLQQQEALQHKQDLVTQHLLVLHLQSEHFLLIIASY